MGLLENFHLWLLLYFIKSMTILSLKKNSSMPPSSPSCPPLHSLCAFSPLLIDHVTDVGDLEIVTSSLKSIFCCFFISSPALSHSASSLPSLSPQGLFPTHSSVYIIMTFESSVHDWGRWRTTTTFSAQVFLYLIWAFRFVFYAFKHNTALNLLPVF